MLPQPPLRNERDRCHPVVRAVPVNNLAEATFVERGYPHSFLYKPIDELITPDFPSGDDLQRIFG
jgi:hypothetical protein